MKFFRLFKFYLFAPTPGMYFFNFFFFCCSHRYYLACVFYFTSSSWRLGKNQWRNRALCIIILWLFHSFFSTPIGKITFIVPLTYKIMAESMSLKSKTKNPLLNKINCKQTQATLWKASPRDLPCPVANNISWTGFKFQVSWVYKNLEQKKANLWTANIICWLGKMSRLPFCCLKYRARSSVWQIRE